MQLTKKQRADVRRLNFSIGIVRGVQLGTLILGTCLSLFTDRGAVPFVLACVLALAMNSALPELPPWLEKMRPPED